MTVSVYMETIAYKYGGAESYTASLIECLQELYPEAEVCLITEHLFRQRKPAPAEVIAMQNRAYGTHIRERNLCIRYFNYIKIDDRKSKSRLTRFIKIIVKELYEAKRLKSIMKLSSGSDLFINASFNLIGGDGRKNICIVHFPQQPLPLFGLKGKIPFFKKSAEVRNHAYADSYDLYLPNSSFTAGWLSNYWHTPRSKMSVLYPPVNNARIRCGRNPHQILACGRICRDKKTDMLIKAYLKSKILRDRCRLVVTGSVINEEADFIREVRSLSQEVTLIFDPDKEELSRLYSSSGIFWHAKGLGTVLPVDSEHFGMATVEAMSAGCIPVVIDKGGQREIVTEDCGFRWNTLEELVEKTEWLVNNPEEAEKMRIKCMDRSREFGVDVFRNRLGKTLAEMLHA